MDTLIVSEAFDIAVEGPISEALYDLTKGLDIHPEVMDVSGPGGGAPVYRFHGTLADLTILCHRYFGTDRHEFEDAVRRLQTAEPSLV